MIQLTKLNGASFALNADLIETIEEMPDTTIRLTNKSLYIVRETMAEVIEQILQFRRASNDAFFRISEHNRRVGLEDEEKA